jgi:hypothetical protein
VGHAGRAIAQAVSRWVPTAAARAGFLLVLRFPLPIFIPPIYPQSPSPIIRGWYNRPVVAAVPKVPPYKLKKKSGARICEDILLVKNMISRSRRMYTFYAPLLQESGFWNGACLSVCMDCGVDVHLTSTWTVGRIFFF